MNRTCQRSLRKRSGDAAMLALLLACVWGCSDAGGGDSSAEPQSAPVAEMTLAGTASPGAASPGTASPATTGGSAAVNRPGTSTQGSQPMTRESFRATDAEFANQERGYAGWAYDLAEVWPAGIQAQIAAGRPLMRTHVRLDNFVSRDLTSDFLTRLDQGFAEVRKAGGKVIPRFVYNSPTNDTMNSAVDANIDWVLRHISQLAPVLQRNADTIAFMEAGFIGAWGEWHTSSSGLTSEANKARIRDALLQALPPDVMILVRSPVSVQTWFGTPVTTAEAFSGTARARIGLHNDCFMSSPTDASTYPSASSRNFAMQTVRSTPFGGETCDVGLALRNSCADILREGRQYAVTYLNHYGHQSAFLPRWQAEGCAAEVARSFGYRFQLESISHPPQVTRGSPFNLEVSVRNVGWARLYKPRGMKVRLVHRTLGTVVEVDARGVDPRQWVPLLATESPTTSIGSITLPANTPVGEYDVWVGLPDASPRLATDSRYAIRFANADDVSKSQRWDPGTGRFAVGTRVTVR